MASPSSRAVEEAGLCPICLMYLQDPVTLGCGHNFCRECITKYCEVWEQMGGVSSWKCPVCTAKFQKGPFQSNCQLASLVEIIKQLPLVPGKVDLCMQHKEKCHLFCKGDYELLCSVCELSPKHKTHTVIPKEEAAQGYKEMITNHLELLNNETAKMLKYKPEMSKESGILLKQTKAEMEKMKAEFRQMHQILEEKEKGLLAQMEEVEKEIAKKQDEHVARLAEEFSSLQDVIRELSEKQQKPTMELLQDVGSIVKSCEKKVTFQNPVASIRDLKCKIWGACDRDPLLNAVTEQFRDTLFPRPQLPKANVTLDPNTTHPRLFLSEDRKHVRSGGIWREVPNLPERFDRELYGLGWEEFTAGRHYWEVMVGRGGVWAVGVARKSVRRKGPVALKTGEGIWAVGRWGGGYRASDLSLETSLPLSEKLRSLWVCLNYEEGQVTFHDADLGSPLYSFSGVHFSGEALLPFFHVAGKGPLTISSRQLNRPLGKSGLNCRAVELESWSQGTFWVPGVGVSKQCSDSD